jgi:uncharacterized membrane protein YqgA involved in biofilm formation
MDRDVRVVADSIMIGLAIVVILLAGKVRNLEESVNDISSKVNEIEQNFIYEKRYVQELILSYEEE